MKAPVEVDPEHASGVCPIVDVRLHHTSRWCLEVRCWVPLSFRVLPRLASGEHVGLRSAT